MIRIGYRMRILPSAGFLHADKVGVIVLVGRASKRVAIEIPASRRGGGTEIVIVNRDDVERC